MPFRFLQTLRHRDQYSGSAWSFGSVNIWKYLASNWIFWDPGGSVGVVGFSKETEPIECTCVYVHMCDISHAYILHI